MVKNDYDHDDDYDDDDDYGQTWGYGKEDLGNPPFVAICSARTKLQYFHCW